MVQPFYLQNIGDLPRQENLWQKEDILLGLEKILPWWWAPPKSIYGGLYAEIYVSHQRAINCGLRRHDKLCVMGGSLLSIPCTTGCSSILLFYSRITCTLTSGKFNVDIIYSKTHQTYATLSCLMELKNYLYFWSRKWKPFAFHGKSIQFLNCSWTLK